MVDHVQEKLNTKGKTKFYSKKLTNRLITSEFN